MQANSPNPWGDLHLKTYCGTVHPQAKEWSQGLAENKLLSSGCVEAWEPVSQWWGTSSIEFSTWVWYWLEKSELEKKKSASHQHKSRFSNQCIQMRSTAGRLNNKWESRMEPSFKTWRQTRRVVEDTRTIKEQQEPWDRELHIKDLVQGQWDGPYHQVWCAELNPQNYTPHRREPAPAGCSLTSTYASWHVHIYACMQAHMVCAYMLRRGFNSEILTSWVRWG